MTQLRRPLVDWPDLPGRPCSVAAALSLLGEKWSLLAIREISYGNHRFVEIARNTGAPRDRLAARLRKLEQAGIVSRHRYLDSPERYEYRLTEAGTALIPVLHALLTWGDEWLAETPPVTFEHSCGHPLHQVAVCRECGQEVRRQDVRLHVNTPGWDRRGPLPERESEHEREPGHEREPEPEPEPQEEPEREPEAWIHTGLASRT